jgi:glycine oxidase
VPDTRSNGRSGAETYDALVVGAGVVGLACAWRLAERGLRVCVLERERPGAGSSSVAAGMLAPVGEVSWGEERLLRANLESAAAWPAFAAELGEASGREVSYRACGALHVALDRDEAEELRRRHDLQLELGLESEWLRPSGCRSLEPGLATSLAGGIHAPTEAEADPRLVVSALAEAFRRAGGEIVTGDEPAELIAAGGRVRGVRTRDGLAIEAEGVVVSTGAWAGSAEWLPRGARPPVRPVKGQILVLRGPEPVCERIVASRWVYLVPRADGRLVVGATVEERGFERTITAGGVHELLREAYRLLPEVAELEIVDMTAGLRPGSPDNAPLVGRGALDGLVLATGHYRNGILLAPLTAEAVAATLTGGELSEAAAALDPARFASAEVQA